MLTTFFFFLNRVIKVRIFVNNLTAICSLKIFGFELLSQSRHNYSVTDGIRSIERMFTFYVSSFLISLCFYIRHNLYCEPYVYSLFSFFEYLTVLANIGYHSIIFYDLSLFTNDFRISFLELNKID